MLRLSITAGLLAAAAACAPQGPSPELAGAPPPEARGQAAPPALPDPPGWRRVQASGRYSLAVPPSLERRHRQGVDSAVDQFVGEGVDLNLDYGLYSGGFSQAQPGMRTERLPGDGRALRWTIQPAHTTDPQYRFTFTARMSDPEQQPSTSPFPSPPSPGLTISMHCRTAELCQVGPVIARSVRFDRRPGSPGA